MNSRDATPNTANATPAAATATIDSLRVPTRTRSNYRRIDLQLAPADSKRLERILTRFSGLLGQPVPASVAIRRAIKLLDGELRDLRSGTKRHR